jgi:hypothetical protein
MTKKNQIDPDFIIARFDGAARNNVKERGASERDDARMDYWLVWAMRTGK